MKRFGVLVLSGVMTLLVACSGGSGGTGAGPDTSTVSSGQVTATDNATTLSVNGTQYSVDGNTTVTVDGVTSAIASIQVGDVVVVRGASTGADSASADSVSGEDVVKGPLEALTNLTAAPLSMTVLGQTILVSDTTVIDNSSGVVANLNATPANTYLEVSGFVRDKGVIAATRVVTRSVPSEYELKGYVENVIATTSFTIGGLTINFGGTVSDGAFVEVHAGFVSPPVSTVTATSVELEDIGVSSASKAEVEGYITAVNGSTVTIGTQEVVVSASTVYENGGVADIKVGREVEAEGPMVAGVIQAIEFEFEDYIRIEGEAASVNSMTGEITIKGLTGITIATDGTTEIDTREGNNLLTDILANTGNAGTASYVRAKGINGGATSVAASELKEERDEGHTDYDVILQGEVTSPSDLSVTILGVTATVPAGNNCHEIDDTVVDCATLIATLAAGDIVKVRGTLSANGASVAWEELERE